MWPEVRSSAAHRAVTMPDNEKMQQARAVLHAADGVVLGAQSLPIGSDWPVVSLVGLDTTSLLS